MTTTATRRPARSVALVCLLAVGCVIGGCQTPSQTRAEHVHYLENEPAGAIAGDTVYPRAALSKTYVVVGEVQGKGQPRPRVRREVRPNADGTWTVRTFEDEAEARTDVLTRTGAGVTLLETTDHARGTLTRFGEGGLLMMPATLRPEEVFGAKVVAEVFGLDTNELQERGTAEREIEWVAHEGLSTPAGDFETERLRSMMTLDLGSTVVKRESRMWVTERGLVGEEVTQKVTVFNVPVRQSTRLMLLEHEQVPELQPGDQVEDPIGTMLGG